MRDAVRSLVPVFGERWFGASFILDLFDVGESMEEGDLNSIDVIRIELEIKT